VVGAVLVVAVVGLVAVYLVAFRGSSKKKLALTPSPSGTQSAAFNGNPVGTWQATTGSEAGYRVREKLARLPAQSDAVGRTPAVTGGLTVADSGGTLVARDLKVAVDVTQLRSDEDRRDSRIHNQGLQTSLFPTATFVSTADVALPADVASGKTFTADVQGDLTIHGVTKRVTIPVQARLDSSGAQVVGSYSFPMSTFSIDPPNVGGFVTVEPNATLEFKVVLKQA
jgi:polyisoprenoid-binding protein YceI